MTFASFPNCSSLIIGFYTSFCKMDEVSRFVKLLGHL